MPFFVLVFGFRNILHIFCLLILGLHSLAIIFHVFVMYVCIVFFQMSTSAANCRCVILNRVVIGLLTAINKSSGLSVCFMTKTVSLVIHYWIGDVQDSQGVPIFMREWQAEMHYGTRSRKSYTDFSNYVQRVVENSALKQAVTLWQATLQKNHHSSKGSATRNTYDMWLYFD